MQDARRRRFLLVIAWGAFSGALLVSLAYAWQTREWAFLEEWRRLAHYGEWGGAKIAAFLALVLVAITLPLAILDGLSQRRFRQAEAELHAKRPLSSATPYEGLEGEGLRFEGPEGIALLLRPQGGLGAPRLIVLAAPEAEPSEAAPLEP